MAFRHGQKRTLAIVRGWDVITPDEHAANLALLAAAPELLAALESAIAAHDEIINSNLPALVKASFAARFNAESARTLINQIKYTTP